MARRAVLHQKQKPRRIFSGVLLKNWRLPTLAEPIGLLPSARLCLKAEFGMGSGRTTALWPPRNGSQKPAAGSSNFHSELRPDFPTKFKRTNRVNPDSLKTAHRVAEQLLFVSFKSHSSSSKKKKKSDQAARPISTRSEEHTSELQ